MVLKDIIKLRFILFLNLYLRGHGIYIYINICNREYIEPNTCVSPYDLGRKGHPPYDVGDAMRRKERREEGRGRKVPEVGTGELGKEAKKSGRIEQEQRRIKERKEGWSKRRWGKEEEPLCGMYVCMCMLVYVCDDDGGFTG